MKLRSNYINDLLPILCHIVQNADLHWLWSCISIALLFFNSLDIQQYLVSINCWLPNIISNAFVMEIEQHLRRNVVVKVKHSQNWPPL